MVLIVIVRVGIGSGGHQVVVMVLYLERVSTSFIIHSGG